MVLVPSVLTGCVYTPPVVHIEAMLAHKLQGLILDPESTREFANTLIERFQRFGLVDSALDDVAAALAKGESPDIVLPLRTWNGTIDEFRTLSDRIVEQFLFSSDFFYNGADMSRTVTYVGWHNPRAVGCMNPFADFRPGD